MTDSPDTAALVGLVGSRIAHDLASPIGAIANGVELLGLTGFDDSPELALIASSVENASARIKLFRIAFGAASAGQTVSQAEINALTAPANGERKLEIDWRIAGDIARTDAKLAFLGLMCLETAMPWGGRAAVSRDGGHLRITGQADRLNLDPDLWDRLSDSTMTRTGIAAAQVHFLLLPAEAAAQARALQITRNEDAIALTV